MRSVDHPVKPIVIPNWENNIGVSAAWNKGLELSAEAGCDVAVISNDDVVLAPGTLFKLVAGVWNRGFDVATAINTRDFQLGTGTDWENPDFSCFALAPEDFLNDFGYFDTTFSPAYFEDNDMHWRIRMRGGHAVRLNDAGMYHVGSVTQFWDGGRVVSHESFRANEQYYIEKWGGKPGEEKWQTPFNMEGLA
jgi:GT2 family glycosyltransferase